MRGNITWKKVFDTIMGKEVANPHHWEPMEIQGLKKKIKKIHTCRFFTKVRPLIGRVEENRAGRYTVCKP